MSGTIATDAAARPDAAGLAAAVDPPAATDASGHAPSRATAGATDSVSAAASAPAGAFADDAFDVLIAQNERLADDAVTISVAAVRRMTERRMEARAEIRRIVVAIAEANRNRGFWSHLVDGLGWLGKALGAAAAIASLAIPGAGIVTALGVGAAIAAGGSALSRIGVGTAERDALDLRADQAAQDGVVGDAETQRRQALSFAEGIAQAESEMRERALAVIETEREGRRIAASLAAAR